MITKYNLYKESLLDKLQGPTKEEVWKKYGFGEPCELNELIHRIIDNSDRLKIGGIFNGDTKYKFNDLYVMNIVKNGNMIYVNYELIDIIKSLFDITNDIETLNIITYNVIRILHLGKYKSTIDFNTLE